ncbi:retrovirus-related pol polyprotein from transposon TNT 1-94 [Tanacetum coccineum]
MDVLHTLTWICVVHESPSSILKGRNTYLVILDDFSRFTWVKFLTSKDDNSRVCHQLFLRNTGVGIFHQKSVPRTPQQNGVVERRNRTLVEAARTMMIFSKAPMFLWAEAVATACYTQNRSLIHTRHNKTPYELVHDKKPDLTFFRVFGALCYPTNDSENLGKFQAKADIGIFVGLCSRRSHQGNLCLQQFAQDAPSTSASSSTSDIHLPVQHQEIAEEPIHEDTPIIHDVLHPSHNLVTGDPGSAQSSSGNVNSAEPIQVNYPPEYLELASDGFCCAVHTELSKSRPKHFQMAVIEDCWFQAMQDEIHEFDRLEVWELIPRPIYVMDRGHQNLPLANAATKHDHLPYGCQNCFSEMNTMAEQNVPAQPPTRTDEQIVPRSQWLTIGKSNLLFNAQKIQKNPIFQISVDILRNTNFFQALTASANVPAIYLQQFWKTMSYNEKTGVYSCQLDEQWFDLSADLLRKALAITPGNSILAHPVHDRKKTSAVTKPRHPVLQIMWGIVTQTNVDMQELIWEDNNNIHRRPDSAVHHTGDDYILGNLKFVPKACLHPKSQTTTPVKQSKPAHSPTKKPSKRKLPQKIRKGKPTFHLVDEEDEARQDDDPDLDLAKKLSLEAHQEKGEEEGNDADLERAIKLSLDPSFLPQGRAPVGGVTIRDPVSETTPKLHEVVGKGKGCNENKHDQTPPDLTTGPSSQHDDDTSEKVIHESSSNSDSERNRTHEALVDQTPEPVKEDQPGSVSENYMCLLCSSSKRHYWSLLHQSTQEVQTITTSLPASLHHRPSVEEVARLSKRCLKFNREILCVAWPELSRIQESKKSPKEIIKRKRNKVRRNKIQLTPSDEDAMDKEVADKVKDHKRKHDSDDDEDDDDDEGPSAGSNQGRSTKRRRLESAASGSAQPPPKDDDQSLKKPRGVWYIAPNTSSSLFIQMADTDTRDADADYSMHRSNPESGHSEQSSDDIPMKDEGNDSDMEDTD